jgi:SAM-dependent methyltransferase
MADTPYDPDAFKAQLRDQWSAVALGWRRRWPVFERDAQPLSDRIIELAQVGPGMRVLDIATGIGEPALTAARRVGSSGSVVAVDQAPHMLAVARERFQAAGVSNVEFIEADAEAVTLPPASFDAIVSRWGLMFFTDPVSALTRLRANLVSGGRFVAAVWGSPQQVPMITLSFAALGGERGPAPGAFAGPGPFSLADPAALEQVARQAGYTDVRSEPWTVVFEFATTDDFTGHIEDVSAPVRAMMASQSPERQAELRGKLASAAARFITSDGAIRLPNQCLIVSGKA